ncbi:spherulation-specific family 4 protein [Nitrososphaera sp.]|uniref:spherulation-specific family 4 protein n=1 Tax=Nitrososphaera sp. TaxID=1971748 RepID=UPI003D6E918C
MMERLAQFFQPGLSCSHATGVYVPLYVYPSGAGMGEYERVVRAKLAHPGVPVVVAINPSSGAGGSRDANYERAAGMLRGAGITVLGYVYTSWGRRSIGEVASEVGRYASWYGADGIMIDEFSTDVKMVGYYRKLRLYARSLGMAFVMGNPGTDIPPQYIGAADNFIIYENAGLPDAKWLGGWHAGHDRKNWSCCSYGVDGLDEKAIRGASKHLGLLYVTDDGLPNPYDSLSSHLEKMMAVLDPAQQHG